MERRVNDIETLVQIGADTPTYNRPQTFLSALRLAQNLVPPRWRMADSHPGRAFPDFRIRHIQAPP